MTTRFTLVLAAWPGLILFGCSSKTAPEPCWVGHLAQLSGPGKAQGIQAQKGIRLAVEETSAAGVRVMSRPLAVRHVDTRGDAETLRAEAVRLIAVSKVTALLVDADATQADRLGPETLLYGLPVLVCGELASPPGENVFVLGAGPEPRGRALARFVVDDVHADSVTVLVDGRNALAGALAAAFIQQCPKNGRPAVEKLEYQNDEELKERVSRLIGAGLSAGSVGGSPAGFARRVVLVAGSGGDCRKVRADLHSAKMNVTVLFGGEDGSAPGLRPEEDGPELYQATAFALEGLSAKGRDFAGRYQDTSGEPPTLAAALAYDGTRLLFEVMRQANSTSGARVREQLAKIEEFESVTGNFTFKDRQARRPVFVVRLKGGAAKVVKTVAAEE